MYNINQLNEISDDQLRELARSMGIKRVDSAEHDNLVYQVLDIQAENEAANAPEPARRRRERIRQPAAKANGNEVTKDDAVANKSNKNNIKNKELEKLDVVDDKPANKPVENEVKQQPVTEVPKKKRGRPSAAEKAARESALKSKTDEALPKSDETQDVVASGNDETPVEKPVRRRGRKPKH